MHICIIIRYKRKERYMGSYDQVNKVKEKYEKLLSEKQKEVDTLLEKNSKLQKEVDDLRRERYEAGEGKGEVNKYKKEAIAAKRAQKTAENQLKELDGSKMISQFTPERQQLIKNIKGLSFPNKIFNNLATKFKSGLDDVIEIAYRIKNNLVDDMDYYTFVFRDNIVGLLEKMLYIATGKKEDSATKYLNKIIAGLIQPSKDYLIHVPKLQDIKVVKNISDLIHIETTAYHGNGKNKRNMVHVSASGEVEKFNNFLNLNKEDQLTAIFTLLEFMYYFFTCKDREMNLITLSSCWFKTI